MSEPQPFIGNDEYILLMDCPPGAMSVDDLKRLADVGVRTVWSYLFWYSIEPRRGVYQWAIPDAMIERYSKAGVKALVQVSEAVTWGPPEWYVQQADGRIWRAFYDGYRDGFPYTVLSPWNEEAQAYQREFERTARDRYNSDTVQCIASTPHGGEVMLPGMVECWYDPAAIADFVRYAREGFADDLAYYNRANHTQFHDWAQARPAPLPNRAAMEMRPTTVDWLHDTLIKRAFESQGIFAESPWREAWYMLPQREGDFAEQFESGPRSGNWIAGELYRTTPQMIRASVNIVLYEVFRTRGTQGILDYIAGYESRTWVGSQYVPGLVRNTASAIALGLRGFLTGPIHPDSGYSKLEPDMVEVFKWSLNEWQAARQ
jgi:hypothetical protein